MIDTVVLEIPRHMFDILKPEWFEPDCTRLLDPKAYLGRSFAKAIQNPSKEDIAAKIYKPRLTVISRLRDGGREVVLKVEFSAPKMLFGNNFDEVEADDLNILSRALAEKLFSMGVRISSSDVSSFPVTTVHFSKNIPLVDYTSVSMVTSQLAKIDLTQRLDLDKTSFRNGGHALRYHANSFELVFYDKIKDLQQSLVSEKRAIEKDNFYQADIFDVVDYVKPFEVLRMEVRLCNRTKLKSVFKASGVEIELNLGSVFKKNLARKVLLHFWEEIDQGLNFFATDVRKPLDVLRSIRKQFPAMKPQKLLNFLGAVALIQDIGGREARAELGLVNKRRHVWFRLKRDLLSINNMTEGDNYKPILAVKRALQAFETVKLANYHLNN